MFFYLLLKGGFGFGDLKIEARLRWLGEIGERKARRLLDNFLSYGAAMHGITHAIALSKLLHYKIDEGGTPYLRFSVHTWSILCIHNILCRNLYKFYVLNTRRKSSTYHA